ncbi:histamine H2 receptor-like [Actinia tenebrosa]|uniref:Histamine H2 receptor-like n=1 Tax=Actinia tenebrosa TaxID=6105 RepID=A0A6P8JDQ1_ACTTE|nr:histamine H2 receptor-like [Actinia tenebrosa]XP_031574596.1 histamine H2 receptor-like [Actinia tenebrosa]
MVNSTNNSTTNSDVVKEGGPTMRALFGVVAGLSLVGNLLLCIVILRRRTMLTKTYNILIFNLAIADMLTGVFLFMTPGYVIAQESFPLLHGNSGDIFCRIVFSTYFLFCFGKASNATVMCLAIDRWYSVIKPIRYKIAFGKRRLLGYIALIWISSAFTEAIGLSITKLENGRCKWVDPPYDYNAERVFLLVHVMVTFYIPSIVTWVSFAQIWYNLSHTTINNQNHDIRAKKLLVRMCALAAFFLTLCWFPTETFFVLKKFNVLILPDIWYWVFNLLGMFNSCINPWVYCLSNKQYRREFQRIVPIVLSWNEQRGSWRPTHPTNFRQKVGAWDSTMGVQNMGIEANDSSKNAASVN